MENKYKNLRNSYGLHSTFTSGQKTQFSDNSMSKTQKTSNLQKTHMKTLQEKITKISQSKKTREILRGRISDLKTAQNSYRARVKESEEEGLRLNEAAVKIQKHVRGYLIRKKIDNEWHDMKKFHMNQMISEVLSGRDKYLYGIGRLPVIAAKVLQKAYRRRLFFKKIMRIKATYLKILDLKEQEGYRKIRGILSNLYAVKLINQKKFERFREKKLAGIKRKLALLSIKKVFAREKISWKIVRIRIRKFKRNIKVPQRKLVRRNTIVTDTEPKSPLRKIPTMDKKPEIIINKPESPENPPCGPKSPENKEISIIKPETTIIPSLELKTSSEQEKKSRPVTPSSPKPAGQEDDKKLKTPSQAMLLPSASQESIITTTTEKEAQARAEFLQKLEEERKIKVALGKISYGVRGLDENRILPYLKTFSGQDPDFTIIPQSPVKQQTVMIPPIRERPIEIQSFRRKVYMPGSYMKETMAFQNARIDPHELYYDEESNSGHSLRPRNNSTLMAPTAAFTQKTMGNPSSRSHSTETKTIEKLIVPSKKFRSNIMLEIPEQPEKKETVTKKIPVLLNFKPKNIVTDDAPVNQTQIFSTRVSISFDEALPEYSEFLNQYTKTPKRSKLEPIKLNK